VAIHDSGSGHVFAGDTFGLSYPELDWQGRRFVFATSSPTQFDPAPYHSVARSDRRPRARRRVRDALRPGARPRGATCDAAPAGRRARRARPAREGRGARAPRAAVGRRESAAARRGAPLRRAVHRGASDGRLRAGMST
jgi:hypothetical protein